MLLKLKMMWTKIYNVPEDDRPRKLTDQEISEIISSIPLPLGVMDKDEIKTFRKNLELYFQELKNVEFCPSAIPELTRIIKEKFLQSLITPGAAIGIYAAHALGSTLTQATLNSFHRSGDKSNVFSVINFLEDMIYAKKKRKETKFIFYFSEPTSYEEAFIEGKKIHQAYFSEFISNYKIGTISELGKYWWHDFYPFIDRYKKNKILRIFIDHTKLYQHRITLQCLYEKLKKEKPQVIDIIISPLEEGIIEIYPNEKDISDLLHEHGISEIENFYSSEELFYKILVSKNFNKLLVKGTKDTERFYVVKEDLINLLTDEGTKEDYWILSFNKIEIYRRRVNVKCIENFLERLKLQIKKKLESEMKISWLIELPKDRFLLSTGSNENFLVLLEGNKYYKLDIFGNKESQVSPEALGNLKQLKAKEYIEKKIYNSKEKFKKELRENKEAKRDELLKASQFIYLEVKSTTNDEEKSFLEYLLNPKFDPYMSYPENMHTIRNILGIEASRNFILTTMKKNLTEHDQYIHPVHLIVLAEFICSLGIPYGANYTGISRQGTKHLTLSTMERTRDVFSDAAITGQTEVIKNVSASVMLGLRMKLGNGMSYIAQDILDKEGKKKTLFEEELVSYYFNKNFISQERSSVTPKSIQDAISNIRSLKKVDKQPKKESDEFISYINNLHIVPLDLEKTARTEETGETGEPLKKLEKRSKAIIDTLPELKWRSFLPEIPEELLKLLQ
jgi:hypothetical protein